MKSGSFRHGTEEGFKKFKCPCVKCVNWENQPEPNEALREAARENADLLTRDDRA